jgi:hypothetical protein
LKVGILRGGGLGSCLRSLPTALLLLDSLREIAGAIAERLSVSALALAAKLDAADVRLVLVKHRGIDLRADLLGL